MVASSCLKKLNRVIENEVNYTDTKLSKDSKRGITTNRTELERVGFGCLLLSGDLLLGCDSLLGGSFGSGGLG
jgi:hypothetical protein